MPKTPAPPAPPSPLRRYNVYLRESQIAALRQIDTAIGIPPAEQIRRALDRWLADPPRVAGRGTARRAFTPREPRS
jgi:hypothetical protein